MLDALDHERIKLGLMEHTLEKLEKEKATAQEIEDIKDHIHDSMQFIKCFEAMSD